MNKLIKIPRLTEVVTSTREHDKDMYEEVYNKYDVLPFYLSKDTLIIPLNNAHSSISRMKCLKKFDNKFKLFGYKTSGIMGRTVYFILDIENQKVFASDCGSKDILEEWIMYLMDGGSVEKAEENNKELLKGFNPFEDL